MIYIGLSVIVAAIIMMLQKGKSVDSGGVIETDVEIEPLLETQLKERIVSLKDTYSFTIDVENFVRICMSDPDVRQLVFSGVRKGAIEQTELLGAANMKESKEDEDIWFSLFAGTNRDALPGQQGFLLRNEQGSRVSLRLKRQSAKNHTAQVPVAQTPGQVIPEAASQTANLLRDALSGNKEAAQAFLDLAGNVEPAKEIKLKL